MPDYKLLIPESQRHRVRRGYRLTRAIWRSLRAVWKEFRWPIVVFIIAVFFGGWVYGQVYNHLSTDPDDVKYYIDMPYQMVALMLFASPDEMPIDARLVVFWYMMPLIGAYVAARGVFDFVNLFYVSNERHRSWEAALASTYKNHVIVLGVGHLGRRVIRQLAAMSFDVVAIDIAEPPEKTRELKRLGVPMVLGDGRLESTLESAAIRNAQALIVCTSNDHLNLEVTMRARSLNPDVRIVVRMWEDSFVHEIKGFLNVADVLSATNLAAPSFAAAALGVEITQTMTIDGEQFSMLRFEVQRGSFMEGKAIGALQEDEDIDIVLHGNGGGVDVHPDNTIVVHAGDTLVLFAHHNKINSIVARNRGQRITAVGD